MEYQISNQELESIIDYKNSKYIELNQLLVEDIELDIALIKGMNNIKYSRDNVEENIRILKDIYKVILKNFNFSTSEDMTFYRNTTIIEIDSLRNDNYINRLLLLDSKNTIEDVDISTKIRPVLMRVKVDKNIPYIDLNILFNNKENKIILAPFTKVKNIVEVPSDNSLYEIYDVELENQILDMELSEMELQDLKNSILDRANFINEKICNCINLDNENLSNEENIRKLNQLLDKHHEVMNNPEYICGTSDDEKQTDLDDIKRINNELENIRSLIRDTTENRKLNYEFILRWKKDLIFALMLEYKRVVENYTIQINNEIVNYDQEAANAEFEKKEKINSKIEDENEEKVDSEEDDKEQEESSEEKIDEVDIVCETVSEPAETIELDEEVQKVKDECQENINTVKELLKNIKVLITKQQSYARIAEKINTRYKSLNNAFKMKSIAEELESLLIGISNKINILTSNDAEELEKISKVNLQIGTLLNYLNNPKNAVSKKIKRFDELCIIEENEFKKDVAEKIKNIRCEAELKKLNDDIDIIHEKTGIQKFFGKLTGKDKIDQVMLEQIKVRQMAIRKTFKNKMPLAHNYSIHEMIAEIEMFIDENIDDELVRNDIKELRNIKTILNDNFVIVESKIMQIINRKSGKNLPISDKKLSKKEFIEIDTYRFLKKYEYDKSYDKDEPEYNDTMPNEIMRIVEYVKSSGII